jgi:hypothetical protein
VSDNDRRDLAAVRELEQLIRALGEEMAAWRRRAQQAEARLKEAESARRERSDRPAVNAEHVAALERENAELHTRLESARVRTQQLLDRMRFLRQQEQMGVDR